MTPLIEELTPAPDPVRCCEQLEGLPYRLFLDSAAPGARLGRYSYVMADPAAVVRTRGDSEALTAVRHLLAPHRTDPIEGLPPFQGGAAGYLAYDWGLTLERLPAPRFDDLGLDDVVIGLYDWVLAWDHVANRAWLISTGIPAAGDRRAARAADRAAEVKARLAASVRRGEPVGSPAGVDSGEPEGSPLRTEMAPSYPVEGQASLRSSFRRADYLAAVARVREYIYAGDIFQANLSQRFEAPLVQPPWAFYRTLRRVNPAPFGAFFDVPGAPVLSTSPERFLRVSAGGHVETRPIKGTRARGVGPEHDAALGQALTESAKDRAENLMIVDLMRNDLSRVCAPGSVRASELFALERYATVHHLVSTVVGDLAPGSDALDLLRAAFPGGSITGAPKLRAMEIIAELEPSKRGVYCGSIGYWSTTGEMDTSIAIRTAVVRDGRIYFSAGGGIVADSDPEQEYQETLDKVRSFIDALASLRP
ncbi:MAG TPA: aminodeoxychorismate synthase component I [Vicinamibacterales bacterium]|nr:aminodeoxychorismate synthase component I [Vicinamibacterales bacterium]